MTSFSSSGSVSFLHYFRVQQSCVCRHVCTYKPLEWGSVTPPPPLAISLLFCYLLSNSQSMVISEKNLKFSCFCMTKNWFRFESTYLHEVLIISWSWVIIWFIVDLNVEASSFNASCLQFLIQITQIFPTVFEWFIGWKFHWLENLLVENFIGWKFHWSKISLV